MYTGGKSFTENEQESEKEDLHTESEREVLHSILHYDSQLQWHMWQDSCIWERKREGSLTHKNERESEREVLHTESEREVLHIALCYDSQLHIHDKSHVYGRESERLVFTKTHTHVHAHGVLHIFQRESERQVFIKTWCERESEREVFYIRSEREALHTSLCRIVACAMPHYRAW